MKRLPQQSGNSICPYHVCSRLSGISPFMGEDDKQTLQKVKRGYWDFEDEVWDSISQEAKEFLKAVLVLNPK